MEPLFVRIDVSYLRLGTLLGNTMVVVITWIEPEVVLRSRPAGPPLSFPSEEGSRARLILMLPDRVWMDNVSRRVKSPLTLPDEEAMEEARASILNDEKV